MIIIHRKKTAKVLKTLRIYFCIKLWHKNVEVYLMFILALMMMMSLLQLIFELTLIGILQYSVSCGTSNTRRRNSCCNIDGLRYLHKKQTTLEDSLSRN